MKVQRVAEIQWSKIHQILLYMYLVVLQHSVSLFRIPLSTPYKCFSMYRKSNSLLNYVLSLSTDVYLFIQRQDGRAMEEGRRLLDANYDGSGLQQFFSKVESEAHNVSSVRREG